LLAVGVAAIELPEGQQALQEAQQVLTTEGQALAPSLTGPFSTTEMSVINEVSGISLNQLRAAFDAGGAELNIGGRTILVDPGVPSSGFTLFGENGFVVGREAFASNAELTKTLLHEIFRLSTGQVASGATQASVTAQTVDAASFAEDAFNAFFGQ
jgi:hypothetical protein